MADKKPTYWEQLKHPHWQKMRLEIMQRDGFACQTCKSTEKTLNVHHTYYKKGHAPWEYPAESLKTLCEDCHGLSHGVMEDIKRQIGALDTHILLQVWGYTTGLEAWENPDLVVDVVTHDFLCGLAHCFSVHHKRISPLLIDGQIDGHRLIALVKEDIEKEIAKQRNG